MGVIRVAYLSLRELRVPLEGLFFGKGDHAFMVICQQPSERAQLKVIFILYTEEMS